MNMNFYSLRVVTWNCNGAFRKKWPHLKNLNCDIHVIQECEDPSQTKDNAYQDWSKNHLWTGKSKNKGLGIFASESYKLDPIAIDLAPLELFLPCLVDDRWPLLATWTKQANSPNFGYIGQLWKFLQLHKSFLSHPEAMLIGDLNSNVVWDEWDRWWNHSDVVRELSALGLESCYHRHFCEAQGHESCPTFYMHRKVAKPYHIDYGFTGPNWTVQKVELGEARKWLEFSDHLPMVFEFKNHEPP